MKKNKGFTLIEILGVIIIIGILSLVIVPIFNGVMAKQKEKLYNQVVSQIEKAAGNYIETEEVNVNSTLLTLNKLYSDKYIESIPNDPRTNEEMIGCVFVNYRNNQYNYKYMDSCAGNSMVSFVGVDSTYSYGNFVTKYYQYGNYFWNSAYLEKILSVTFKLGMDSNYSSYTWFDVSTNKDNSIIAYLVPNNSYYDLIICSDSLIGIDDLSNFFRKMTKLQKVDFSNLNTMAVTNMSSMFQSAGDSNTGIGFTYGDYFDTSNVTNMSNMFWNSNIKNIDISNFNTSNVTDMTFMFAECNSLIDLKINGISTINLKNASAMFSHCTAIKELDLSQLDFSNVTIVRDSQRSSYGGFLENATSLVNVSLPKNINSVTDLSNMFYYCTSLETINFNNSNFNKATDMSSMFFNCYSIKELNLSNFNTTSVTNMSSMFHNCYGLTSLDLSSFNTINVIDMSGMFNRCSGLTSLNISSFNTSKVIDLSNMFDNVTNIINCSFLNYITFNSNVYSYRIIGGNTINDEIIKIVNSKNLTILDYIFSGCILNSIDLSSLNTANVTSMVGLFSYASIVNSDFSKLNTSNITDMSSMFSNCYGLTSLDLSGFNTSKVTSMSSMFNNCYGLTSLNLSNFNTINVTSMSSMFYNCYGLTNIYVSSNWNTDKVTSSSSMFYGCTKLPNFNSSITNKTNANITSTGYLTLKV